MKNLILFISGHGSNLEAIIKSSDMKKLYDISLVISNNPNAHGLNIAKDNNIETEVSVYDKDKESRKDYDTNLVNLVNKYNPDLIVLAGWMYVFTNDFLKEFPKKIINLHPALPGKFPGKQSIHDAYEAFTQGKIKNTGIMVHYVVEEIDAGEVLDYIPIPLFATDNYKTVEQRIKILEKPLLLSSIRKAIANLNKIYIGKVRDVIDIGYGMLQMNHSNRLSAFDKHVCEIEYKGKVLNLTSKFWFKKTKHITPNHYIYAKNETMIVKKCVPFKIEVIIRNYITGSLWNAYNNGSREYCGIKFPDNLVKNQKLPSLIVTPTTKGDIDEPITAEDIIKRKLMTQYEWNDVREKALELFKFGENFVATKDLILVDTKYEFGKDENGNILLIDEIHTCDSSRFWVKSSYKNRFLRGESPEKLDKDLIRDSIKEMKIITGPVKENVKNAYISFYSLLTNNFLDVTNSNFSLKKLF